MQNGKQKKSGKKVGIKWKDNMKEKRNWLYPINYGSHLKVFSNWMITECETDKWCEKVKIEWC